MHYIFVDELMTISLDDCLAVTMAMCLHMNEPHPAGTDGPCKYIFIY